MKGPNAKKAALDKLLASPKWKARLDETEKKFLTEQIKANDTGNEGAVSAVAMREVFDQEHSDRNDWGALEIGASRITVSSAGVVRTDAAGKEEWFTPLNDGVWVTGAKHDLIGDSRRVFACHHPSNAITAIAADTGKVLWRKEVALFGS